MQTISVILLNNAEIQSGTDRVKWAEGLILQLPADHEGRNSWLLNYGKGEEAKELRRVKCFADDRWDFAHDCLKTVGGTATITGPPDKTMLDIAVEEIMPMFEGMERLMKTMDATGFVNYCQSMMNGGIAMKIRNHLHLWDKDSNVAKYFIHSRGLQHPDNMTAEILREVHARITSQSSNPQ